MEISQKFSIEDDPAANTLIHISNFTSGVASILKKGVPCFCEKHAVKFQGHAHLHCPLIGVVHLFFIHAFLCLFYVSFNSLGEQGSRQQTREEKTYCKFTLALTDTTFAFGRMKQG